ncbi:MAG: winged helix-turn-helix transcriptional regulator [Promethearchaeota archaeon]
MITLESKTIQILLIEDNLADVRLIEELLKKSADFKYKLESYSRLSQSLNRLNRKNYDIILLDLTLPDSPRESTLERVLDNTTTIPIIILTGLDDTEYALESIQKGAQDYLVKGDLNSISLTRSILYSIERHRIESKKASDRFQKAQFDEKDKEILNIMQKNYRIPYKELSEKVNLAPSTIHNRVQNMIKEGIIRKFDTIVNPFKVGFESIAILGLSVDPLKLNEVAQKLVSLDEIQLVATSTGDHNLILRVIASNEKELWRFINEKIKTIVGIETLMDVSSFIDIFKLNYEINFKTKD